MIVVECYFHRTRQAIATVQYFSDTNIRASWFDENGPRGHTTYKDSLRLIEELELNDYSIVPSSEAGKILDKWCLTRPFVKGTKASTLMGYVNYLSGIGLYDEAREIQFASTVDKGIKIAHKEFKLKGII